MSYQYIVVDNLHGEEAYPVNTLQELADAEQLLADVGEDCADVWELPMPASVEPENYKDARRTTLTVWASR